MYAINLPEHLYKVAAEAADAQHLSIDEFVADAVQLHVREYSEDIEPIKLTEEQLQEVREAQEEVRRGEVFTLDEAQALFEKRRAEHLKDKQL